MNESLKQMASLKNQFLLCLLLAPIPKRLLNHTALGISRRSIYNITNAKGFCSPQLLSKNHISYEGITVSWHSYHRILLLGKTQFIFQLVGSMWFGKQSEMELPPEICHGHLFAGAHDILNEWHPIPMLYWDTPSQHHSACRERTRMEIYQFQGKIKRNCFLVSFTPSIPCLAKGFRFTHQGFFRQVHFGSYITHFWKLPPLLLYWTS